MGNYAQSLWLTVSGLGNRDTTCAIVGGSVALHVGTGGHPRALAASARITALAGGRQDNFLA